MHKQPTSTTAAAGTPSALTATVLYDARARVVRSSRPGSATTSAGTTFSVYYTAGANSTDAACGNRPEWAGQPCRTLTGGAVTGHDPAKAADVLPIKTVTGYNRWGTPTVVTESATGPVAGSSVTVTRTTSTTYDAADRVLTVAMTGTGTGAGTAIGTTRTVYDPTSGDVTSVQLLDAGGAVTSQVSKAYDALGRLTSYTDASGQVTTSTYDQYGRPATQVQQMFSTSATTTYTYDDPRGYLTAMVDSQAGTISADWGPDGQLLSQTLPGGIRLSIEYDPARVPIRRTYTDTATGTVLFTDTVVENHKGQWLRHESSTTTATYGYDVLGRLTGVSDTPTGGACTVRAYRYDQHSNRVSSGTASAATAGAACPTVAASTTATYDSADRLVSTAGTRADEAWTYDPFGRTTSMPSPDLRLFICFGA